MKSIMVVKRDGRKEELNLEKIHMMVEEACDGLNGVSASHVEMNSKIQFDNGITTKAIQNILIKSAADLISLETPNYQYVAARLLLFNLRKEVFGQFDYPSLREVIQKNVDRGVYDPAILLKYTEKEITKLSGYIRHERDFDFAYAGLRQVVDKYLVQDRSSGEVFETPQFMYMMIAATIFSDYPTDGRLRYVKDYYDMISTFKINIPTPIMAGIRTPMRQFASCVLVDFDDTLDSIFSSDMAVGRYTAQRAGIGTNVGRLRGIGSKIRGGEVEHTGFLPFLKKIEATTRCCTQNGVRGGCVRGDSIVEVIDSIEISGKTYGIDDTYIDDNGSEHFVRDLITRQIKVNTKKVKIQDVVPGMMIRSFDIDESKDVYRKVINTMMPIVESHRQYQLTFDDGGFITTSNSHPMLVWRDTWVYVPTMEVVIGDVVKSSYGTSRVVQIEIGDLADEQFYDIEVAGTNNYFAVSGGSDSLYVIHNSSTTHVPIWHQEIESVIVLKNNKGTEDNRVRKMDYSIQISKLFYERFIKNQDITLFSPHDVAGLYDAWGTEAFDNLYLKYEKDPKVKKWTVSAHKLFLDIMKERAETGRIYIQNIDHSNTHSAFLDTIHMSNLCQEINLPTKPIQHIDDVNGEIATCILSAVNLSKISKLDDMERICELAVRALDQIIDYQDYPVMAAKIATLNRRSLGIGFIGLAHYLAKHKVKYSDPDAWKLVHQVTEALQFYLLKASNNLAKEKGACTWFDRTKYSKGILPIDTYKKTVDDITAPEYLCDWEALRQSILDHGLRNSTLTAQMPSESSSQVCNTTNGIEPPRAYLSTKKSKKGPLKQLVPDPHLKNYSLLWDMPDNDGYTKVVAVMQKFFDQAISVNTFYNPEFYPNNEVPMSVMMKDLLSHYKYGTKSLYYSNVYDAKKDDSVDDLPLEQKVDTEVVSDTEQDDETCDSCTI